MSGLCEVHRLVALALWPQSIPIGGTGRTIDQVLDSQVGSPSIRVFGRTSPAAQQLAADLLVYRAAMANPDLRQKTITLQLVQLTAFRRTR